MGTEQRHAPMLRDVVEEHAEEAAFLWLLRDRATGAPHFTLDDLEELEERIEAHLDGLRIAGDGGRQVVEQQLANRESGEVFVAAFLALEQVDAERFRRVVDVVAAAPDAARGLISALAWAPNDAAMARLGGLLQAGDAVLRSVGIAASVAHGNDPGIALVSAVASESSILRRRAFAAAGRLGRTDLVASMLGGLTDPDPSCRFHAAATSALLGESRGISTLQRIAEEPGPYRERAGDMASRFLDLPKAIAWQRSLAMDPDGRRAAVTSAGAIGDPALVPWVIEQMADPETARLAGEAFTMITGVDLVGARLTGAKLDRARADVGAEDEDMSPDPDHDLAWPAAERVAGWWAEAQARMSKGQRYLMGHRISDASTKAILRDGRQRQRAAAALERLVLGLRPPFDLRAPASIQRARLA